jgi:hypothetical protein
MEGNLAECLHNTPLTTRALRMHDSAVGRISRSALSKAPAFLSPCCSAFLPVSESFSSFSLQSFAICTRLLFAALHTFAALL